VRGLPGATLHLGAVDRRSARAVGTVAYYRVVKIQRSSHQGGHRCLRRRLVCGVEAKKSLAFDNDRILAVGLERIKGGKVRLPSDGFELCHRRLTTDQLTAVVRDDSRTALDKRNFRQEEIMSMNFLSSPTRAEGVAHGRPGFNRFDRQEGSTSSSRTGFNFEIARVRVTEEGTIAVYHARFSLHPAADLASSWRVQDTGGGGAKRKTRSGRQTGRRSSSIRVLSG